VKIVPVPRIAGALLFEPVPRRDERGFFCRTADADVLREASLDPAAFVQDSVSRSARGVHLLAGDLPQGWIPGARAGGTGYRPAVQGPGG
jgi:hypothetical protein